MARILGASLAAIAFLTFVPAATALRLDPGFGKGGVAMLPHPAEYSVAAFNGVATLPGGRSVAVGSYRDDSDDIGGPVVAGFDAGGNLDPAFAGDGILDDLIATSRQGTVGAIAPTAEGRLIVIGDGATGDGGSVFVAVLFPDGTVDPSFGTGGIRRIDVPDSYEKLAGRALEILPDGSIQFTIKSEGERKGYSILSAVRLRPDGSDADSFGRDGRAAVPPQALIAGGSVSCRYDECLGRTASGMVVDAAGRTWLSSGYDGWHNRLDVARLTASGRLDQRFGKRGRVHLRLPSGRAHTFLSLDAGPLAAVNNGRVAVAAGMTVYRHGSSSGGGIVLAELTRRGRLERTFGSDGFTVLEAGNEGQAGALLARPDGGLIVTGSARNYPADGIIGGVAPNGAPDRDFGKLGVVLATGSRPLSGGLALAEDGSGGLLVAGSSYPDKSRLAVVARYLP